MPGGAIGLGINNPGDLTVNGPNSYLYPGQSGVIPHTFASGHTLYFAEFADPTTGFNALVNSIAGRISKGFNTVTSLVHQYLGTTSNNVDNPHVNNYIATVAGSAGVGANDQLTTDQASQIAIGIAKAEGTSAIVPNGSNVVSGGAQVDPGSVITGIADYPAALITGILGGNTSTTVTGAPANNAPIAQTGADTGAGINTAVGQGVNSLTSFFTENIVAIAVIAGAALLGVVALSSAFNQGGSGGKTTVVPVPV